MTTNKLTFAPQDGWLKSYYFTRAAFSAVWVAAAFTLGARLPG